MIKTDKKNNIYLISIVAPFTLDDVYQIIEEVEGNNLKKIILDISELTVINSYLIGLIVRLIRNMEEISVSVGITGLKENDIKTLEFSNLTPYLEIFSSVEDGIKKWS